MRVALIVYNQVNKGTYWRAYHLGRHLARRGHQVDLLATAPRARRSVTERVVEGMRIVETPDLLSGSLRSGWDPWNALRRVAWQGQHAADVVHAFEARPVVLLPALAAQRRGATLIMDWCDWFGRGGSVEERPNRWVRSLLRPVETWFEESFRPRADGTTVINSVLAAKACRLGVPSDRIHLLPNGADLEHIVPQDRRAARQRLGLPQENLVVAYTGALFRRDAELMARTFDLFHARQPLARLLLIGYCNLPVEQWVQAPSAVWRTGPVTPAQLADYLAAADAGWLPLCDTGANQGRFPMKLADFMAAGLPVVATDVADVGRLVREAGLGWLAPDQPEALAEAVLACLAETAARAAAGRIARQTAEERFAWPQITAALEQFYCAVMKRP